MHCVSLNNQRNGVTEFESHVVKATKEEGYDGKEVDDAERQWSVSGALLYSITVITTIGIFAKKQ